MKRPLIALLLLMRFLRQVVGSGLTTAWLILSPGRRPQPDLVRMRYDNLDELGVTILGCMITLTPGTTTIDVDTERGELLLHLLDARDIPRTVANIRRQFETPLQQLFPARKTR